MEAENKQEILFKQHGSVKAVLEILASVWTEIVLKFTTLRITDKTVSVRGWTETICEQ